MKSTLIALCLTFALFFLPSHLNAATAVVESAEWVIATSDRLVIGTVVGVDSIPIPDRFPFYTATIAISKTLKGQPATQITVPLPLHCSHEIVEEWRDKKIPILFCIIKNHGKRADAPSEKFPWLFRDTTQGLYAFGITDPQNFFLPAVCTRDDRVLTKEPEILEFFENTIKETEASRPVLSYTTVAPPRVFKHNWGGSMVLFILPVDAKLEALGQTLCADKNESARCEGAKILRYFKSDKNIAILNSLLTDPTTSEYAQRNATPSGENQFLWRKKVYNVRLAAYSSLKKLGVNPTPPTFEILLEGQSSTPFMSDDLKELEERDINTPTTQPTHPNHRVSTTTLHPP